MVNPSDEIKTRLDIASVLGEYIKLQPAGSNFRAKCPFHQEKTPSLMVSPDKQIWHCFGCGKGGDIFTFVMEMEGLTFPEALRLLAPKAGVQLSDYSGKGQSQRNQLLDILVKAGQFYQQQLQANEQLAQSALNYLLQQRQLTTETIQEWQIGWAPNQWQSLSDYLKKQGYSDQQLLLAGLSNQSSNNQRFYDRFRGRIMFPWHDVNGNLLGFSARVLPQLDDGQMGKYINSPQSLIYDKSRHLFGLWLARTAIKEVGCAVIVEGQMDCIMAYQQGFNNVVATSGTALTEDHLKLLKRYTDNLVLAFDMDQAGLLAADRAVVLASQFDINIKLLRLPAGQDPDEFLQKEPNQWAQLVDQALPIMEYYFEQLQPQLTSSQVADRKSATREFLTLINKLTDIVERDHWLKELARVLQLDVQLLYGSLPVQSTKTKTVEPTKTTRSVSQIGAVELLLAWLIKFPSLIDSLVHELESDLLGSDWAGQIYKNLIVYYNKQELTSGQSINYNNLINWWTQELGSLDQEMQDYLNSLFLLADKDLSQATIEQATIESSKLVKTIKRDVWQGRLTVISQKIAELEDNQEISQDKQELEINILLAEAAELSQGLGDLEK